MLYCDFFYSHVLQAVLEIVTVYAVAITDEKTRRGFIRKGVDDLLSGPFGIGIRGNIEVNDTPPVMTEHDEDVEDAKGHRRNGKEITGGDVGCVIVQKCPPSLGRRFSGTDHVFGHGRFGNLVARQGQFGYDPRRTPGRVLPRH